MGPSVIQRTTRINFVNSYTNQVCFCFIKCQAYKEPLESTLEIFTLIMFVFVPSNATFLNFFGCSFPNTCSIVTRVTWGNWYVLFYGVYKESFPLCQQVCKHYENLLGNTKWCSVNWLRRIFCQCQCHLFYFFLYVSCFGYSFTSLCYVVATYIHHHLRTQDKCLRQKDESNAEMCFGVAPLNIR